ncbi:hypothetical protein CPIN17262_0321 [Campylobacter pinnipediorum subsp. pinnipediorum]|nr:hypothetical protein CPIN17262_0321 [Campylobacter pinnipediorum subsp. pinnipediorum]
MKPAVPVIKIFIIIALFFIFKILSNIGLNIYNFKILFAFELSLFGDFKKYLIFATKIHIKASKRGKNEKII